MNRFLLPLFSIAAIAFLVTIPWRPYAYSFLPKALPILLLLSAVLTLQSSHRWLLGAGLFFSAGGDVLLDLKIQHSFILGLSSFLIAHLLYLVLFLKYRQALRRLWLVVAGFLIVGAIAAVLIAPRAGALAAPVGAYIAVITLMGVMAALTGNLRIIAGAALFILSDAGIAWNKFIASFSAAPYYVMVTYYCAQGLIFFGSRQLLAAQNDGD